MNINSLKNKIIIFYKELFFTYINNFSISDNKKIVEDFVNKMKLSNQDYLIIEKEIIAELQTQLFIQAKELQHIINLIKNKLQNYIFEYISTDNEPTIYFHIDSNKSYLINYDLIEEIWYLSLIETDSLKLIEEIYSSCYEEFIIFLTNYFNKKKPLS